MERHFYPTARDSLWQNYFVYIRQQEDGTLTYIDKQSGQEKPCKGWDSRMIRLHCEDGSLLEGPPLFEPGL